MPATGPERRRRRAPDPSSSDEEPDAGGTRRSRPSGDAASRPDVYLDVPKLEVDHIGLEVEDLRAHVSLQAEVLDLLKLNVGVDVQLGRVALEIDGVQAEATLKVRLDEVAGIIDRVLDTIDRNPQILETLARTAQDAVQEVGSGVGDAAGSVGRAAGDAVGEVAGQAGGAVDQLTDQAGNAVGEITENAGDTVGEVTDQAGDVAETAGDAETDQADTRQGDTGQGDTDPGDTPGTSGDDPVPSDDATPARVPQPRRGRGPSTPRPRPARRATG
ncbi:MAG: Mannose-1-phosphate guanylyltransferase (GDP) [uncultured Actinomycetospora sp.]|uniref:Mannose-1-phosphate guanylyltransferase (GDP) n=1 Tax=uncultured Actinomycetospora sp. TaxID=1135996 RepID=A0A6J4JJ27_9PSEU|nr:MAG: Mannose-1-phosphate guanylyltransferase (GDP) [uncultured Actinomycetospora sp.]